MALSIIPKEQPLVEPGRDLQVGGDDFSVRVEHPEDPRFWIRIERDLRDGIVVTDFTAGNRPEDELHAALLKGVAALSPGAFSRVIFRDIVPGGEETEGYAARIATSGTLARRLAASLAELAGRAILRFELEPRRDKLDAIVTFVDR